jgi:glucosyl-dolichyl phosphate glucuronosyltransferase
MADHRVSVVICAYTDKRWSQTCAAVNSVRAQSMSDFEIILVVDHNEQLYQRLSAAFTDVIIVENCEAPGVSGARNTGAALARGDIVAFLDDDAAAEPDWLKFICDSYDDPAVMGVGGLILPRWETGPPRWFPPEFYWVVGCSYLGIEGPHVPVRNLIGANMSFRREAFEIGGGFRIDIGRNSGERPYGGEETEFCIRLGQESPDSVLVIENRAAVSHLVTRARCRFSYFTSRCFAEGLSKAQVTTTVGGADGLSSERRYATRTLPKGMARGIRDLLRGDVWGLARTGAIAVALATATAGYIIGSADRRVQPEVPGRSGFKGRATAGER